MTGGDVLALGGAPGPLIGLDLGTKTIGVAVSDRLRMTATPVEVIARTKFTADADRLGRLAADRGAVGVVLGLPVNMDGSEGPRAQSTRAFGRALGQRLGLAVAYWDERLSTVAVTRTLIAADQSRKRRAQVIDKLAAAYILQGALDRLATQERLDQDAPDRLATQERSAQGEQERVAERALDRGEGL